MLLLYFLAAGVVIGQLRGGSLEALGGLQFRWWAVALAGLAFQLLLFSSPLAERVGDAGPALYVASSMAVFAALLRNVSLPGVPLIAVGAGLNLLVIVLNAGYMPSAPDAWAQLNGLAAVPAAAYSNSILAGPGTLLPILGDILVLPHPLPFANVFSIGDVLIGLGAAWCIVRTMTGRSAVEVSGPEPDDPAPRADGAPLFKDVAGPLHSTDRPVGVR